MILHVERWRRLNGRHARAYARARSFRAAPPRKWALPGALRFPSIRRIIADEMRGWIEKGRKKDRKGAKEEEDGRENGGLLRTDGLAQNASTQSDSDCNFFTIDFDSGWPIHLGILHSKMLTLLLVRVLSRNAATNRALACGSPLARDWRKTITADATAEEKRRRGDGGKQPPPSSV